MLKKIIIIGAGEGGKRLVGELLRTRKYNILGFLDDNLEYKNKTILGYKVLGKIKDLALFCQEFKPDEIIIAIPSLKGARLDIIINQIQELNLKVSVIPGIFESINYQTSHLVPAGPLRSLELGDLLERQNITLDIAKISGYLHDNTILVTGAGGSIGSELVRRIQEFSPKRLILLDVYENHLYELQQEINNPNYRYIICDIKDTKQLEKVFLQYAPDIIFHAAAHKHVPLMEDNPAEAIKNNIFGSDNLINLAIRYEVKKFIFISSDKAISPTSIMGVTKRFTEEEILSQVCKKPIFAIVRFGNVLGSYGSVVPLWDKQRSLGRPISVTHPDMTRYFMTIPEAVQLVIQAGAMSEKSNIFVLKMGKQFKILDLARKYLKLSGIEDTDKYIIFTGVRPAEKLSEILNEEEEILDKTVHPMIMEVKKEKTVSSKIKKTLNYLKENIDTLSKVEVKTMLKKTIPSYNPPESRKMPKLIDYMINFSPPYIGKEEENAVQEVLKSKWLTMGPKVLEFEKEFSGYMQMPYAISTSSATAGLHLVLSGLGIGKGDEVIVPSYTFASCANTIVWTGAKPVFADIQKQGFVVDPEDIERKITSKTKALLVVHFGGQMAAMDDITKIAKKYKLKIIEDCAHSPGAEFDGQLAGTIGDAGVYSFYATKNLTSGEGGMVVTKDDVLNKKMKILRLHGMDVDAFNRYTKSGSWAYKITEAGFKDNMTDLAAAIGIQQLKKLEMMNQKRANIARNYGYFLAGNDDILLPTELSLRKNVWHLYPILVNPNKRDYIINRLKEYNVISSVHFIPIHLQPFYQKTYGYKKGDLPVSEWVYEREISLPMHPGLKKEEIAYIGDVINYSLTH